MWERHRRRRARTAVLGAIAVLLAATPSTTSLHPTTKLTAARMPRELPAEELRVRVGNVPVGIAAPTWMVPAAASAGEVAIAPPPATFDAPVATATPPPDSLLSAARADGGIWAVVIGIDDYPGRGSDLRQSVTDANDVDAALAAYGIPPERRVLLRNTQATAAVIADSLRWLVGRAGRDATAVFFYAGHVRKLGAGSEAIVAADGNVVTDARMADLLRPLAARQTWIALASCYAGGFTEVLAPGRILTGAADADNVAYENSRYGNSYLVEYMIDRAMREGRAAASVEQSFAWARDELRRDHPNRVPVQFDQLDGELRLGPPPPTSPQSSPPPRQPPPQQPPPQQPPPEGDDDCVLTLGSLVGCDDEATDR